MHPCRNNRDGTQIVRQPLAYYQCCVQIRAGKCSLQCFGYALRTSPLRKVVMKDCNASRALQLDQTPSFGQAKRIAQVGSAMPWHTQNTADPSAMITTLRSLISTAHPDSRDRTTTYACHAKPCSCFRGPVADRIARRGCALGGALPLFYAGLSYLAAFVHPGAWVSRRRSIFCAQRFRALLELQ